MNHTSMTRRSSSNSSSRRSQQLLLLLMLLMVSIGWPATLRAQCGNDPGNDSTGAATNLSGCGTTPAAFDCAGDLDYYRFTAPSDSTFTIETTGSTDTVMQLLDDEGGHIETNDDDGDGNNARIIRALSGGTTYFIRLNEYNDDDTGNYTLSIDGCAAGCPGDGDNNDSTHAESIATCGATSSAIDCAGDVDWFVFGAPADGTYTWTLDPMNRGGMVLYAADGTTELDAGPNSVSASMIQGDFTYITVSAASSSDTFSYTLTTSGCPVSCGNDPGNDSTGAATNLSGCGTTPAAFDCAGDLDYYRFTAPSDSTFTIETTGSTDTVMQLLDDEGGHIETNDDDGDGNNARIVRALSAGTTYFIRLNEYNDDDTGNYTLSIDGCAAGCPGDGDNNDSTHAESIATCGATSSAIDCAGDVDWFVFGAPADGTYTWTLDPINRGGMVLYAADGTTELAAGSNSVSTSMIQGDFTYIAVSAASSSDTFSYTLTTSGCQVSCGNDPGNDSTGAATNLSGCGTTPAAFDCAGDLDYYRFTAPSDSTFTIETTGSTDTVMQLLDDEGGHIETNDDDGDGNNARIVRALSGGTTYFIRLNEYNDDSTGDYTLSIDGCAAGCPGDGDNNDSTHAESIATCGATSSAIDCAGDVDWFVFGAPADGTYTWTLDPINRGGMVLYAADGTTELDVGSNSVSASMIQGDFTYIAVSAASSSDTFSYTLTTSGCPVSCGNDPGNDSTGTATNLSGCGSTPAAIDCSGDVDFYRFTAPAASSYTFQTNTVHSALVGLYDGTGSYIDQGTGSVTRTLASGETVYVRVLAGVTGETFSYDLVISGCSSGGCGNDPGNDTTGTATNLSGCGTTPAAFDCAGDLDYYRFTAPSDSTFTIETTGSTDTVMQLLDDQGGHIETNDDDGESHNARIVRALSAGTTYFIRLNEYNDDDTGDYTLSIDGCNAGCAGDPGNDDIATASTVTGCGSTPAAIDCSGDVDFYRFTAPAASSYTFQTSTVHSALVGLYDGAGSYIDQGAGSVTRTLASGETVSVRVLAGITGETFSYDLVISGCSSGSCGNDPDNDSTGTATNLSGCGGTAAAIDCAGDVDYYAFTAPNGGSYQFAASGGGTSYIQVTDSSGATINAGVDSANATLSSLQDVFIRVGANQPGQTFSYSLDVSGCSSGGCGADPGNDTPAAATTLVGCGSIQAAIDCAGDVDHYGFTAPVDATYSVSTSPPSTVYISLLDAAGAVIDSAVNTLEVARSAGQYLGIEISALTNGETPLYDLAISGCSSSSCGADPGNDTTATATALPGCNTISAQIDCPGDHDLYSFTAPSDGSYVIETGGSLDTVMEVLDSTGNPLASDDDSGNAYNARVAIDLAAGTPLFVAISEFGDDGTGGYDLTVDGCSGPVCGADPGNDHRSNATQIAVPGTIAAAFECPGDVDYYRLDPGASTSVRIETTGSSDTQLWLENGAGSVQAFDDNSGNGSNAAIVHNLAGGETAYLRIEEANAATGSYTVAIDTIQSITQYQYVVAATARVSGVAGTNWSSDLVLYNPSDQSVDVTVEAWRRDHDNTTPLTTSLRLGAHELRREPDALSSLFGMNSGAAALNLVATTPLVIASRTFNTTAEGTYGQYIPGVAPGAAVAPGTTGYLHGLVESSAYRSNLGLVNLEARPIDIKITFRWPDGTALGSTETMRLPPHGYIQRTQVLGSHTTSPVDLAWAELTSTDGRFLAYASVVDQGSGDPVYRPVQVSGHGRSELALPGLAKVAGAAGTNWVSDLAFLNPGSDQVELSVELWQRDADNSTPQLRQVVLAPGACLRAADALASLFAQSSGAASARVSADAAVLADGRTFNQVTAGSYGQYIAGMEIDNAISPTQPAYLVMVEEDGAFRTNLGLMNVSSTASARVQLTAYASNGAQLGSTETINLAARDVRQLNRVLHQFTAAQVTDAVIRIAVDAATPDGRVVAYGSVVDESTGDPIFVLPVTVSP